jgi:O-antigen ligase
VIAGRVRALPREAIAAAGIATVLLIAVLARAEADHYALIVKLLAGVAAIALVFLAWWSDPAWSISGALACSIFSGNWRNLGFPIGPDRLLFAVGLLAFIVRSPGARDRPAIRSRAVHWALGLAALWGIGSAFVAGSIHQSGPFYGLLDRLGLVPFAAFVIAPVIFRTARQRGILLCTLVATGAYLGLTALFETVGPRALVYPKYILDPTLGIHYGRARGPFLEADANGLALYACAVAAGIAFVTWRSRRLRIFAGSTTVLCLLGTLLTLTRAIWLATVIATLVTMIVVPELRRFVIPTAAGLAVVAVGALVLIPSFSSNAHSRTSDQGPIWDRLNTNRAALNMISARPLVGFGWGEFPAASTPYFTQASDYPMTGIGLNVHNVFLAYMVELGLVGFVLWAAAFLMAVGGAVTFRGPPELYPWRVGLIAIALDWIVVANFVPLSFAFPNMIVWLWAGVVMGPRLVEAPVRASARPFALARQGDPVTA